MFPPEKCRKRRERRRISPAPGEGTCLAEAAFPAGPCPEKQNGAGPEGESERSACFEFIVKR